jgi:cation:H+ antiporter
MAGGFTLFSIFLLWLRFRRSAMRAGALAGVSGFYILFGLFVGWRFTL